MALAETAHLVADLSLKGNFASQMKGAQGVLGKFDARLSQTQGRAFKAGQQIGTGIRNGFKIAAVGVGLLTSQVALGLRSLVELEQATAQTEAVIKSTGGVAGITAKQVGQLAEKYEALNATVGDEVIRSGQNLLLTFTAIRKDAFEPALAAALDMNTALGKGPEGLTSTVMTVGKALNDPARGLTALRRVGVQFTAGQEKQIKALVKTGDTLGAQKVILAELNKEFGGSFLAEGGTTGAKVAKFTDSIEDLQRALGTALLPTVGKIADKLSTFLADPKVIDAVERLGDKIAGLFSDENIATGAKFLTDVFNAAKAAAPALQTAAEVTGKVIGTAVAIFKSLPPEIQSLAVAGLAINKLTGGLVTNIAGGLIGAVLKQLVSGVVNVNGAVVNVNGVPGGGGGVPPVGPPGGIVTPLIGAGVAFNHEEVTRHAAEKVDELLRRGKAKPTAGPGVTANEREDRTSQTIATEIRRLRGIAAQGGRRGDKANTKLGRILSAQNRTTKRVGQVDDAVERSRLTLARKKLSVVVNNSNKAYFNGRLFSANAQRYEQKSSSLSRQPGPS